jgi:hypothetical protein
MENIVEKDFFVLRADKINKHHRIYTKDLVKTWMETVNNNEMGVDIEYSITNEDLDFDYLKESQICGIVKKLYFKDDDLYCTAAFDIGNSAFEYFYNNENALSECTVVPRGKGTVRNQTVQDDYELVGFDLILQADSTYQLDTEQKEVKA